MCLLCHGNKDVWEGDQLKYYITEADFSADIHWQKGLRCKDCHGGNDDAEDLQAVHAEEDGFRTVKSPADVPAFCGNCHANIDFMRRYTPSPAPINWPSTGRAATASDSRPTAIRKSPLVFPATINRTARPKTK